LKSWHNPRLAEIIEATPTIGLKTFLVTRYSKPYTAASFCNGFRERCEAALPRRFGPQLLQGGAAAPRSPPSPDTRP